MKNFTKSGLLSALAVVALLAPSCKKDAKTNNDAKTNSIVNQSIQSTGKLKVQSMNSNLVAYWPMDGNGADLSGNGHTATITGSVTATTDQFGNANHAMHFDNSTTTGNFMTVADAADLRLSNTDYTINAWVQLDNYNSSSGSQIMSKRDSGPNGWGCSITGTGYPPGAGFSYIGVGAHAGGNAISHATVSTSAWHMVTYVYHNATGIFDLYIDGVLDTPPPAAAVMSSSTANLTIGYDGATSNYYFNGDMDEIRIYSKALTASDISDLKTAINPGGILAYWSFDGNANDFSGNNFNGTATSVTSVSDHNSTNGFAYGFNGSSSYVSVPDNTALRLNNTDFTLNAWVKLNSIGSAMQLMAKRSSTADGWGWSVTTAGKLFFGPGGLSTSVTSSGALTTGVWHMVTLEYQKMNATQGIIAHYIDGVQSGTAVLYFPTPGAGVTDQLVIGRDNISSNYFFNGSIDDVRIYNKLLTPGYLNTMASTRY
ncbi:MAG: 5-Nucleotidase domain protein [Mucilaginibacter sp.]|nr:5-Nucleotidase domain protein [Mucilaginibacter sp.]